MSIYTEDELWTISDIAKYLKLSTSSLYKNWRKLGVQPVVAYPGAKPRFPKQAVIRAVMTMKVFIFLFLAAPNLNAQVLTASYYTRESCLKESGQYQMANKEALDDDKLTAASWSYRFGTVLLVKNLSNGKTVKVTVTDRGPAKRLVRKGQALDLSKRAFRQIASLEQGLVKVRVEEI